MMFAQDSLIIKLDKSRVNYGDTVNIIFDNNTLDAINYYIDLDVFVDGFWGAADTDIMNPTREMVATYKIQTLKPGEKTSISYNTKILPRYYTDGFSKYRMSLHCINRGTNVEKIINSDDFEIILRRTEIRKRKK